MTSAGKSQWKTFQRFAENLVFNEAPKVVHRLQNTQETLRTIQQAVKITANIVAMGLPPPPAEITAGRPVTDTSSPTAAQARKLTYSPTSMAEPTRAKSCGPGWFTKTIPPRAKTGRCSS